MKRVRNLQRLRALLVLACAVTTFGLGACTRSIPEDLGQKGQVFLRDLNHSYDSFSKLFFNHDPNDPYLD